MEPERWRRSMEGYFSSNLAGRLPGVGIAAGRLVLRHASGIVDGRLLQGILDGIVVGLLARGDVHGLPGIAVAAGVEGIDGGTGLGILQGVTSGQERTARIGPAPPVRPPPLRPPRGMIRSALPGAVIEMTRAGHTP
jgi:hypothetical protein